MRGVKTGFMNRGFDIIGSTSLLLLLLVLLVGGCASSRYRPYRNPNSKLSIGKYAYKERPIYNPGGADFSEDRKFARSYQNYVKINAERGSVNRGMVFTGPNVAYVPSVRHRIYKTSLIKKLGLHWGVQDPSSKRMYLIDLIEKALPKPRKHHTTVVEFFKSRFPRYKRRYLVDIIDEKLFDEQPMVNYQGINLAKLPGSRYLQEESGAKGDDIFHKLSYLVVKPLEDLLGVSNRCDDEKNKNDVLCYDVYSEASNSHLTDGDLGKDANTHPQHLNHFVDRINLTDEMANFEDHVVPQFKPLRNVESE